MKSQNSTKTAIFLFFILLFIYLPQITYSQTDCDDCDCVGDEINVLGKVDETLYPDGTVVEVQTRVTSDEAGDPCVSCCEQFVEVDEGTIKGTAKIPTPQEGEEGTIIRPKLMLISIDGDQFNPPIELKSTPKAVSANLTEGILGHFKSANGLIDLSNRESLGSSRVLWETNEVKAIVSIYPPNPPPINVPAIQFGHQSDGGYFKIQDTGTGELRMGLNEAGMVWEYSDYKAEVGEPGFALTQPPGMRADTAFRVNYDGNALMAGFQMPTGSADGYVLTSDAVGNGSWQASGGGSSYWQRSGNYIYPNNINDSVGIGTDSPDANLKVNGKTYSYNVTNSSNSVMGIRAYASNTGDGRVYSGYFTNTSSGPNVHYGVYALSNGSTTHDSASYGVYSNSYGYAFKGNTYGIFGSSTAFGDSGISYGGYFIGGRASGTDEKSYGVYCRGTSTHIGNTYGGYFSAGNSSGTGDHYGIYATAEGSGTNYAGYFDGDVEITGTISKGGGSFKIDHPLDPENKYLMHSFIESPDMKNVYDGVITLDQYGEATVQLPEYFEALNSDFRYQLTCIGGYAPVYISDEISNNEFKIAGGTAGMKISWQVTGIRKDAFAEKYRIPVEVEKSYENRGLYLHPKAFDLYEEKGINYKEHSHDEEIPLEMEDQQ